ncbi:hypothetical protein [Prauserella muralis]|uniref:Uncharacterized protein n=1 Tax=Prauserella muralis TaxID=588067 RepID=A0A2V4B8R5_9PSEU|nr:hypothetical protein [Prauserella muralis]PXY31640.1 hypothetical protein BAY60_04540 [Prauserella muralis]TWE13994.1 hypothetical protein FHX69_6128 [Prauserella muralis]
MRKLLTRTAAAAIMTVAAFGLGGGIASADVIDTVEVPSHPTGADYVNAWNESGGLAGAGAAGLVSSAWAGAFPSIAQGAMGGLG